MAKKTINLNIRIEPHIKEKAQKLARDKHCTITELIEGYIVSDYAMRSLFNMEEDMEYAESNDTM